MGIKGLPKLIRDETDGHAIRFYKFSKFKGSKWVVAVDASNMIHMTVTAIRASGKDLVNKDGQITSHIYGLFHKILIFLENDIIPIFVFDGKAQNLKDETLAKRRKIRDTAREKLKKIDDTEDEEYIKNFKQSYCISSSDVKEAKILLDLMGIPYISAPGEADVVCAWLATRKNSKGRRYCKGVCSEDSDMLVFGTPYLFRGMSRFLAKDKPVEIFSLDKTLRKMNLTMDQFVDLCVLLGTDGSSNIPGIGPAKSLALIRQHKSLEKILPVVEKTFEKKNDDEQMKIFQDIAQKMRNVQTYFKTAVNEIDELLDFEIKEDQLTLRLAQYDELLDFMIAKHNFDIDRIGSYMIRLRNVHQNLNTIKPNNSQVHRIISPINDDVFAICSDDIECLSDTDTESEPELKPKTKTKSKSKTKTKSKSKGDNAKKKSSKSNNRNY